MPLNAATIAERMPESVRAESADAPIPAPGLSASEEAETLMPRSLSGLFDEAFDLYKRHFTTIALTVACLYLPTLAIFHVMNTVWLRPLEVASQEAQGDAASVAALKLGLLYILELCVLGFGLILASGPATVVVAACSQGQTITVAEAFRRALPAFPRLAAHGALALFAILCASSAGLAVALFVIGVIAVVFSSVHIAALANLVAVITVIALILAPYLSGAALMARFFLLTPALTVLENLPLNALMERSGSLARAARFRRVWLAAIFLPLVTLGLQLLVSYAADSVIEALRLDPFKAFAAQSGTSALFSFLLQPYWIILLCLLYFDCRARRDGLDVSRLADAAGLPHPTAPLAGSPTLAVPLTIYKVNASVAQNPMLPPMPYYAPAPPQSNPPQAPTYLPPPGGLR